MASSGGDRCGLLSGNDMVKHHTESYELQAQFNRLVSLDELDESRQDDLKRMKEQFRLLLSQERVSNADSISEGRWENDQHRVRITKLEGKWQTFGYEDSTGKYVESHEALFLMEMNRLMVTWNDVVVSIEQGYSLLLGHAGLLTLEEYQVYSILNRASYYLLRYDPSRKYRDTIGSDFPSPEERCVWANLYEMLNQPNPRESLYPKRDPKMHESVKKAMIKYNKLVKNSSSSNHQSTTSIGEEDVAEPVDKKHRLDDPAEDNDGFKMIEQFRRMFDRFDVVQSVTEEDQTDTDESVAEEEGLRLVFDLFATESHTFKKTLPPLPLARILVRRSSQTMPHFRQLQRVYQQQTSQIPLMLMLVSDTLSVHCFLYDLRRISRNVISLPDYSKASSSRS